MNYYNYISLLRLQDQDIDVEVDYENTGICILYLTIKMTLVYQIISTGPWGKFKEGSSNYFNRPPPLPIGHLAHKT